MKMRIRLLIAFFCAHFFATPIAQAQVGFIASGNSLPLAQMIQATARPPAPLPHLFSRYLRAVSTRDLSTCCSTSSRMTVRDCALVEGQLLAAP